jgi:predicted SprT family Zn-dependent metalloprotease
MPKRNGKVAPQLTVELERASLRALSQVYDEFNRSLFKNRLQRATLMFIDREQRLGQWCSDSRRIELARPLLLVQGWGTLVEVLKHEMAHQFVEEVLEVNSEGPHGPTFRRVCQERGIDAKATGMPRATPVDDEKQRVLTRIAKLLNLAQSSDLHEAETAMSVAQRLMLKYNLEHAAEPAARGYQFVHLGRPTGRVGESDRLLAALLSEHFFVEVIWVPVWRPFEGKRGSVLEVCGTSENVELASYVHTFLTETAERLWNQYRVERTLSGNAERREFVAGVMTGFRDKLAKDKQRQHRQGLVWVGDAELNHYLKRRHPHVRWMRGTARRRPESWAHGREAGKHIILHKPVKAGSGTGPKLLPGR